MERERTSLLNTTTTTKYSALLMEFIGKPIVNVSSQAGSLQAIQLCSLPEFAALGGNDYDGCTR